MPLEIEQGMHPKKYGADLIEGLGIKEAPIDEYQVADFLGYSIEEMQASDFAKWPGLSEVVSISPAHLLRQSNIILVKGDLSRPTKRVSIFHEFGHEALPWHSSLNFACSENPSESHFHKLIEKEAFSCGSEILMPTKLFVPDIRCQSTSIQTIKNLALKYVASLESTAVKYAELHPGTCAVAVVEPSNPDSKYRVSAASQLDLPLHVNSTVSSARFDRSVPLRVKYCVRSKRFKEFIHPGAGIAQGNPIFAAWSTSQVTGGRVFASTFSMVGSWACNVECQSFLSGQFVLVLLSEPDIQSKMTSDNGGMS